MADLEHITIDGTRYDISDAEARNDVEQITGDMSDKADKSALTDGSVTKVGTSSVGSGTKPIYLDSGTPTESTSTVGSSMTPVYMKSGAVTECDTSLDDLSDRIDQNATDITTNKDDADKKYSELNSALAQNVTTTGTDLNDYKTRGTFYFSTSYTPTNIPAGSNGWLQVFTDLSSSGVAVKQLWYRQGTPDSNDFETYVRTYSSSTWGSWHKYFTEPQIQRGYSSLASSDSPFTITFPEAFSSAPIVVITPYHASNEGYPILTAVTTTGFTFRTTATSGTFRYYWIAIAS